MTGKYEIAVLYHPSLEVDLAPAEDRVKKIVADNDGKITETDNWGKRKLAYSIKKQDHAVYVFYIVELPTDKVAKVESTLNITDEVIRFLIVKYDEKAIAAIAEAKAKSAQKAEAKDAEADTDEEKE